jgi:hypothetical protein
LCCRQLPRIDGSFVVAMQVEKTGSKRVSAQ